MKKTMDNMFFNTLFQYTLNHQDGLLEPHFSWALSKRSKWPLDTPFHVGQAVF